jgi:hypothetical protein
MPKGPKGEKRPADVIGNAVEVIWIGDGWTAIGGYGGPSKKHTR